MESPETVKKVLNFGPRTSRTNKTFDRHPSHAARKNWVGKSVPGSQARAAGRHHKAFRIILCAPHVMFHMQLGRRGGTSTRKLKADPRIPFHRWRDDDIPKSLSGSVILRFLQMLDHLLSFLGASLREQSKQT